LDRGNMLTAGVRLACVGALDGRGLGEVVGRLDGRDEGRTVGDAVGACSQIRVDFSCILRGARPILVGMHRCTGVPDLTPEFFS
jgi:hypothetical protein